jgi:hypothetical protein
MSCLTFYQICPTQKFLSDSFAFCNQAVAAMTPEKLDALAGPENRKMAGFEWLWLISPIPRIIAASWKCICASKA